MQKQDELLYCANYLLQNLEDYWSPALSTSLDQAREKAQRDGHGYRTVDRESVRGFLEGILNHRSKWHY